MESSGGNNSNSFGLICAFIGCLGFGSFGAPLKCNAVNMVNGGKGPDPFVLQTYKSAMCFLTSWLVLLLGADFVFTPWGIISGILWVSGGVGGIYGIRNVGLAISVGTWSSITVLVSFAWGIFVFGEQVKSKTATIFGILMMILGFIGMAYFSLPSDSSSSVEGEGARVGVVPFEQDDVDSNSNLNPTSLEFSGDLTETLLDKDERDSFEQDGDGDGDEEHETSSETLSRMESDEHDNDHDNGNADEAIIHLWGMKCDKKILFGILGAALDGILGGSNLIPMKLAPSIDRGIDYVISFGIGAAIATIAGWILLFCIKTYQTNSLQKGHQALPSMYLRQLIKPGVLSGLLWSIGNTFQILCVTYLGESIGMSIIQSQMIVSGVIGIIYFGEIRGLGNIVSWVFSALVTFVGIVFLSHEHKQ